MDIQNLEQIKDIKTEIMNVDENLSQCNIKTEHYENVVVIKGIKREEIAHSGFEEYVSIKAEFKSEGVEETGISEFVELEDFKCEIKDEEMDISYPSLRFEKHVKGSSPSDSVTLTEDHSDNLCNVKVELEEHCDTNSEASEKCWQKIDEVSTGAPRFKRAMRKQAMGRDYKYSCTCCEKRYTTKQSLDDHIVRNHNDFSYLVSSKVHNCPSCDYKTTVKNLLKNHLVQVHSGNREKHSCRFCEKHFKMKISLDDHIMKNHKDFSNLVSSEVYKCPECLYKTTRKGHFNQHKIKVHSGNYEKHTCTRCEKNFKEKASLDDHIIKYHQNFAELVSTKIHICINCDYKTTRRSNLIKHRIKVHSDKNESYSCTHCGKHFGNFLSLKDHISRNHQNPGQLESSKISTCSTCDYETTETTLLERHIINIHEKHSCPRCEKHFKTKQSLDNHIVKHHQNFIDVVNSRVHSCLTCDFKTTRKTDLRRHMVKVHSDLS